VSAGVEGPTKTWQARFIPLADPAAEAFVRLKARGHYRVQHDLLADATDVLDRQPADREEQRDYAAALRACDRVLEVQRDLPGLDLSGL